LLRLVARTVRVVVVENQLEMHVHEHNSLCRDIQILSHISVENLVLLLLTNEMGSSQRLLEWFDFYGVAGAAVLILNEARVVAAVIRQQFDQLQIGSVIRKDEAISTSDSVQRYAVFIPTKIANDLTEIVL